MVYRKWNRVYVMTRKPGAHDDGRDLLVVTVFTPAAASMQDLSLEISEVEMRLVAEGATPLALTLAARVDDGAAKAKYDKKSRTLTIKLPVGAAPQD